MPEIDEGRQQIRQYARRISQGQRRVRLAVHCAVGSRHDCRLVVYVELGQCWLADATGSPCSGEIAEVTSPLAPPAKTLAADVTEVITAQQFFTAYLPLLYEPMVLYLPLIEVNSDLCQ